jgi:hypothetical protein
MLLKNRRSDNTGRRFAYVCFRGLSGPKSIVAIQFCDRQLSARNGRLYPIKLPNLKTAFAATYQILRFTVPFVREVNRENSTQPVIPPQQTDHIQT